MADNEVDINADTSVPVIALICMQQMNTDANFTLNALVESYKHQAERLQATLDLIRIDIDEAYSGPYAPSERQVLSCLYPSEKRINNYIALNSETT